MLATQGKRALGKDEFTQSFVVPRIKRASKYRMLCEEISRNYFYIVENPQKEPEDGNSDAETVLPESNDAACELDAKTSA